MGRIRRQREETPLARFGVGAMVTGILYPILSSVLSTFLIGGVMAVLKSINSQHKRFDKIEEHLRRQDLKIARIEGKLNT